MTMDKDTAYRLFTTCKEIADRVPEIAPEVRDMASIFQNPGRDVPRRKVIKALSEILRINTERSRFLSLVNTERLAGTFNDLAKTADLKCSISYDLLCGIECRGMDGLYATSKGLMRELTDMMKQEEVPAMPLN